MADFNQTPGHDTLTGTSGDDKFYLNNNKAQVTEKAKNGNDTIIFESGYDIGTSKAYTLAANIENLDLTNSNLSGNSAFSSANPYIVNGNELNNKITIGDNGSNLKIMAGAGNDTVYGGSGNDNIDGGVGNDTLNGYDGYNTLFGGYDTVTDSLIGGSGNDTYILKDTKDVITDSSDENTIKLDKTFTENGLSLQASKKGYDYSVDGISTIDASAVAKSLTLTGNAENATTILGGSGADVINGGSGDDVLVGGAGNDTLYGGAGSNSLNGGAGNDTYLLDGSESSTSVVEAANGGIDTIKLVLGSTTASVDLAKYTNVENIDASLSKTGQTLHGDASNNLITGGSGNDTIDGGAGVNTLVGGKGNDTYTIHNNKDKITELANGGSDTISFASDYDLNSAKSYTLGANLENLDLTNFNLSGNSAFSSANPYIVNGNELNNKITIGDNGSNLKIMAGAGNDTVYGGSGNDNIDGGTGVDTLYGGDAPTSTLVSNKSVYTAGGDLSYADEYTYDSHGNQITDNTTSYSRGAVTGSTHSENVYTYDSNGRILEVDNTYSNDSGTGGSEHVYTYDPHGDVLTDSETYYSKGVASPTDEHIYTYDSEGSKLSDSHISVTNGVGVPTGKHVYTYDSQGNQLTDSQTDYSNGAVSRTMAHIYTYDSQGNQLTDAYSLCNNANGQVSYSNNSVNTYDSAGNKLTMKTTDSQGRSEFVYTYDSKGNKLTDEQKNYNTFGQRTLYVLNTYTYNSLGNQLTHEQMQYNMSGQRTSDSLYTYTYDLNGNQLTGSYVQKNASGNVISQQVYPSTTYTYAVAASNDNTLFGGYDTVTDFLIGGSGNDTYILKDTKDVITDTSDANTVKLDKTFTEKGLSLQVGQKGYDYSADGISTIDASAVAKGLTLAGNAGTATTILGGSGADVINGGSGDDVLVGGAGNDTLYGGAGSNSLTGGAGNDTYLLDGSESSTSIVEAANGGIDTIKLTLGSDTDGVDLNEYTNVENIDASLSTTGQTLHGDASNNLITGGSGNDTIDGGAGVNTLVGGKGNDTYTIHNNKDKITELANGGSDTISFASDYDLSSANSYTLGANLENLDLRGFELTSVQQASLIKTKYSVNGNAADNTIYLSDSGGSYMQVSAGAGNDSVYGGSGNDYIDGGAGNDYLEGGAGNDYLSGGAGNDTLDGGAGLNYLDGGAGNDTYLFDGTSINAIIDASGTDTIKLVNSEPAPEDTMMELFAGGNSVSLAGYSTIENLDASSITDEDLTLSGNALDNTITGGAGNDTIYGGAGKNTLIGGAGNDTYLIDGTEKSTTIIDSVGENQIKLVADGKGKFAGKSTASVSVATYKGVEDIDASAITATNFTITGDALANNIVVGSGNNTINAGGGNNFITTGNGDNTVTTGSGNDEIHLGEGHNVINAGDGDNFITTGAGNDTITTGSGDDTIYADEGNNFIHAGGGNNSIYGGSGNDTYYIESETNVIYDDSGIDTAIITDNSISSIDLTGSYIENLDAHTLTAGLTLIGGGGQDGAGTVSTGSGNDNITYSNASNITINSNAGNDIITAYNFSGSINGGAGNDTYNLDETVDATISDSDGIDTIKLNLDNGENYYSSTTYSIADDAGIDNLDASVITSGMTLIGNELGNIITGGAGNDTLIGGLGNDTLTGGDGANVYQFNQGDAKDLVTATNATDIINIDTSTGITKADMLFYTDKAGNFFIDYTKSGVGGDIAEISAGKFDDATTVQIGISSINISSVIASLSPYSELSTSQISALSASDKSAQSTTLSTIWAVDPSGDNIYLIDGSETKTIKEVAGQGIDTLQLVADVNDAFVGTTGLFPTSSTVSINDLSTTPDTIENIDASAIKTTDLTLTGNGLSNTITGGAGNDTIFGGDGGFDTGSGASGFDVLLGGAGDDTISFINGGSGSIDGGDGSDNINLIGGSGISLYGGAGNDTITANGVGFNTIDGGAGNDTYQFNDDYSLAFTSGTIADGSGNDTYTLDKYHSESINDSGAGDDSYSLTNASGGTFNDDGGKNTYTLNNYIGATITNSGTGADTYSFTGGFFNSINDGGGKDTYTFNGASANITDNGTDDDSYSFTNESGGSRITDEGGNDTYTFTTDSSFSSITDLGGVDTVNLVDNLNSNTTNQSFNLADSTGIETIDASALSYGISIIGTAEAETIIGSDYADTITAGSGNNTIISGLGNDLIHVGSGNNIIHAGGGNNTIYGGTGNNTYYIESGTNVIHDDLGIGTAIITDNTISSVDLTGSYIENVDAHTLTTGLTLTGGYGQNGDVTVSTGSGNDNITYTALNNITINSNEGDDVITAQNCSNLTINGGAGNDTITNSVGGSGEINGGDGNDTIAASSVYGFNIDGGAGNDTITASYYNGNIAGGAGDDTYNLEYTVTANISDSEGIDTIKLKSDASGHYYTPSYSIANDAGIDNLDASAITCSSAPGMTLTGNGLDNTITGTTGNDTLDGGAGTDKLVGGSGNDTYILHTPGAILTEGPGAGNDTVKLANDSTITAVDLSSVDYANIENIDGSASTSALTLTGSSSGGTLTGGTGENTYYLRSSSTVINDTAGIGTAIITDNAISSIDLTGSYIENVDAHTLTTGLTLTGGSGQNGDVTVSTGSGNDSITYSSVGNVTINSNAGDDTITVSYFNGNIAGGAGDDTYNLDYTVDANISDSDGIDTIKLKSDAGGHYYVSSYSIANDAGIDNLDASSITCSIAPGMTLTGNALNNTITGGVGSDTITGGAGNDVLTGGAGSDTYQFSGGDARDLITATNAADIINIDSSTGITTADVLFYTDDSQNFFIDYTKNGISSDVVEISAYNYNSDTTINVYGYDIKISSIVGSLDASYSNLEAPAISNLTKDDKVTQSSTLASDWILNPYSNNNYSIYGNETTTITEPSSGGIDTLKLVADGSGAFVGSTELFPTGSTVSIDALSTTPDTIEKLNASAITTTNLTLIGNNLDNSITGGAGNDTIIGGVGNDTLTGGDGANVYQFNQGDAKDLLTATNATDIVNIDTSTGITKADMLFYTDAEGNFFIDYTKDDADNDLYVGSDVVEIAAGKYDGSTTVQIGTDTININNIIAQTVASETASLGAAGLAINETTEGAQAALLTWTPHP